MTQNDDPTHNLSTVNFHPTFSIASGDNFQAAAPTFSHLSYAQALKNKPISTPKSALPKELPSEITRLNFSRIEVSIDKIVLSTNTFMTNMSGLMQEMLRM